MSDYSDCDNCYENQYYSDDTDVEFVQDSDYDSDYDAHTSDGSNTELLNRLVHESAVNKPIDDDNESVISCSIDAEFNVKNNANGTLYEQCDYCNSYIKCAPFYGKLIDITEDEKEAMQHIKELHFCDICCAKLFNDCVHKVDVDYKRYNKSINGNHVDKFTADIYKRVASTPFGALPVYIAAQENETLTGLSEDDLIKNRVVFHNIYRKVVRNIMNY